ncbi:MAG: DEAD/DEAH box helicase family protein [Roseateles sp.]|uniref:DEAD/DEAH box helicase family protein n=1 Tax=Roseateles sp. TaxID=1971397 RepID=UPI0040353B28
MDAATVPEWRNDLQATYRSGSTSLSDAFFKPCLREATRYRRAAGYFSSTALLAWAEALEKSGHGGLSIELLISPELSSVDRLAIERSTSHAEREAILRRGGDALVAAVLSAPAERQHQADYLVWLLASGSLQLQFALPSEATDGIFHRKIGVFEFGDGARVAFEGSANETAGGYRRNHEGLQVFRSWVPADEVRLQLVDDDMERLWSRQDDGVVVVPVSSSTLGLVRERAEQNDRKRARPPAREDERWAHQRKAVAAFLTEPHGVLQMATGTGKTRTALQIASTLLQQRAIDTIIVSTEGNDLLDQWCGELLEWRASEGRGFTLYRHFGTCWRRSNIDPPCRFNIDPGMDANRLAVGCG